MVPNKKKVGLSHTQSNFFRSQFKYTLFCGGLGSGKTHAGAIWAISMALRYPGAKGLITANSYSQLKKATLSKLFQLLQELEIDFKYNVNDGVIKIGASTIYALSMEKPDLLRGIDVGWAWSDECAFYKEDSFNILIGRLRDKKGPCLWKGTTTPNGYNWLYTCFVEDPLEKSTVVYSKTSDNIENLTEDYVDILRGQYDTRLARQELDGEFVNLNSGKIYYAFDRSKHVRSVTIGNLNSVFVGLDFNVNPLCGVFAIQKDSTFYIVDELYLENSNTFQAAKEIIRRYPHHDLQIVPDETGNRRKSSAAQTDHEILRRANLAVINFKNPQVKDRQNNINRLLDYNRLFISPNCKKLIQDLEKLTYDTNDEMLGHITDALGYVTWHLDPLRRPRRPARVQYR